MNVCWFSGPVQERVAGRNARLKSAEAQVGRICAGSDADTEHVQS